LFFPEGLRWHDSRLWLSDFFGDEVIRLEPSGPITVASVPGHPAGLGWLPDGSALVVSSEQRAVLRIDAQGGLTVHADLRAVLEFDANDMAVSDDGVAYVGNLGFDVAGNAPPAATSLVRVEPDGVIVKEGPGLVFPNGAVLVDGGRGLIVAETFADRLSYVSVGVDARLDLRRDFARLPPGSGPDGIDVDADGAVWVACAFGEAVVRVLRDGSIAEILEFPNEGVYCCVLGGEDGRTLHVALASTDEELAAREPTGRVVTHRVDVPGQHFS